VSRDAGPFFVGLPLVKEVARLFALKVRAHIQFGPIVW
jgi:hypothetical protein